MFVSVIRLIVLMITHYATTTTLQHTHYYILWAILKQYILTNYYPGEKSNFRIIKNVSLLLILFPSRVGKN